MVPYWGVPVGVRFNGGFGPWLRVPSKKIENFKLFSTFSKIVMFSFHNFVFVDHLGEI